MNNDYLELTTYDNNPEKEWKFFKVPYQWAEKVIKNDFGMTTEEFLNEYTWDDSELIYFQAIDENVLLN
jgi:hypothetical protein